MLPSCSDIIYFCEVATELNFSRAAKKLNISQPSLSFSIKRLEKNLDTHLFIRHQRGVSLTSVGQALYIEVKKWMLQWEDILSSINLIKTDIKGNIKIGCHSTLAIFMSSTIVQLLEQYPELNIHFHHELSPKIMDDVVRGDLDIGIVTDPYPHQDAILQKISDTEFTYFMTKKNDTVIDLIKDHFLVICDPTLAPSQYLLQELQKLRLGKPFRTNAVNQLDTIAALVTEGGGIGILPSKFYEHYFGDKVKKIPHAPIYKKPLCLAYRKENKNILAIQTVLQTIKKVAQMFNC